MMRHDVASAVFAQDGGTAYPEARRFRWAIALPFVYALLYPVLSIDVAARLLARSSILETGNLALLLFYELSSTLRSLLAVGLAAWLILRKAENPAARALAWFLVFAGPAQAIAFGSSGYAGPLQELIATTLRGLGLSQRQLVIAFAEPAWPAWLALGAFIRFSILFPEPLSPDAVERSGARDRTGILRSVPGAGLDIGHAARKALAALLRQGWLDTRPVWITAIAGALLSIVLDRTVFEYVLWIAFALLGGAAIAALRAAFVTCGWRGQQRVRWLASAAVIAGVLFACSAVSALARNEAGSVLVSVLLTLAPLALLAGLAAAVLLPDPGPRPGAA